MPRQPAAIDRDNLRAAVRTLGHEDVFYMLDDAIDVIFFADEVGPVAGDLPVGRLRPRAAAVQTVVG